MWFGDGNPQTIPGDDVEDAQGMANILGMPEDFSYTSGLVSTIDGEPLGSLAWWDGKIDNYNSEDALAQVVAYYDNLLTNVDNVLTGSEAIFSVYPNPAKNLVQIESDLALVNVLVYDILGQPVMNVPLNGDRNKTLDISGLAIGVYNILVKSDTGKLSASKIIKQ